MRDGGAVVVEAVIPSRTRDNLTNELPSCFLMEAFASSAAAHFQPTRAREAAAARPYSSISFLASKTLGGRGGGGGILK